MEKNRQTQVSAGRPPYKPVYETVGNRIREYVRVGELKPGDRLDSPMRLAEKFNISQGTLQYSLRKLAAEGILVRKPRAGTFVSDGAETICSKNSDKNNLVLLIVPDLKLPVFAKLSIGVQECAHECNIHIVTANTDDTVERYVETLGRHIKENAFGIVLVPPFNENLPLEVIFELQKSRIPVVACFREVPGTSWPLVACDDLNLCRLAAKYLCECRCKNIGYIIPRSGVYDYEARCYTFMNVLLDMGVKFNRNLQLALEKTGNTAKPTAGKHAGYPARWSDTISRWLAEHADDIDGLCCGDDGIAFIAIETLKQMGKRVPEDVAVIGAGNLAKYLDFTPNALTTVAIDYHEMGMQAFKLLSAMRNGEKIEPHLRISLKGKIIAGNSTAP